MRFLIVGYGVVGKATALLLRVLGHDIWVYDKNPSTYRDSTIDVRVGLNLDVDAAFICTHEEDLHKALELVKTVERIAIRATTSLGTIDKLNRKYGNRISHIPEFPS